LLLSSLIIAVTAAVSSPPPHVIFITVDTLRADRVGFMGNPHGLTPNLDAWASNAQIFEESICEIPLTGPSFGAMLSSLPPRSTGMTRNGLPMPLDVPLATEVFQEAGYHTVCIQSNWTLKRGLSQLDRGFEVYDDDFRRRRWVFLKSERRADEVTDRALEALEQWDGETPLFLWVHYTDPHAPYRYHRRLNPHGRSPHWVGREESIKIRYDTEVAYTDEQIGRLMEALPTENTAMMFIADHGESLFEHDYLGHGRRVNEPSMHVPFAMSGPGIEPGRTSQPTQGIDVGPTLLGLAGLPVPATMTGIDLVRDKADPGRIRVVETYGGAVPRLPGARALMADAEPQRQAVYAGPWKLVVTDINNKLFHLGRDPGESESLLHQESARVHAMRDLLAAWEESTPVGRAEAAELTAEDLEALESLGYLE
jgi:arylsulfatase A-like enzyme